jgi:3-oxoacyl-[acyl-carrier protein] reductase
MSQEREIALVTGAGRGIGKATAQRLAEDGFEVVVVDIDGKGAMAVAAELTALGHVASGASLNIRDRAAVSKLLKGLRRLDVVVNNAAIFWDGAFETTTEDDFLKMFDVNVVGTFIVAQEASRLMGKGGRIINIASRAYLGGRAHAAYSTSKAAVVGLTRSMAIDLVGQEIAVNAVAPGLIETDMFRSATPTLQAQLLKTLPTSYLGQPEDIANGVAYFASSRTKYVTGQVLIIDGGRSLGVSGVQ